MALDRRFRWLFSSNRQVVAMVVFAAVLLLGVGIQKWWLLSQSNELPDIQTEKETHYSKKSSSSASPKGFQPIELNTADSTTIVSLPGIGPKLTHRILKNRNTYGPFYAVIELRRIYGFDTIAPKIEHFFYVDTKLLPAQKAMGANSIDINQITEEELRQTRLLPTEICHRIISLREKKHGFRKVEDLKKVYGMTDSLLQVIEKYAFAGSRAQDTVRKRKITFLDLNQTDSIALEQLPGIGAKLAARIIIYRNKLGFYHDKTQIMEVYGMKAEFFQQFSDYVYVANDISKYPHIQINTAEVSELGRHPYVGFTLAKRIVAYRTQHGKFKQLGDLMNIKEVEKTTWEKLLPYLSFN